MTVNEIIKDSTIDGNVLKLPNKQLDRKTYIDVKKKLELIGGKWKGGKVMGFVFEQDPTALIDKVVSGDNVYIKIFHKT